MVTALLIVNLVIVSLLLGALSVGIFVARRVAQSWSDKIAAQEDVTAKYAEHIKLAADSNNALVKKVVELTDRVSAHEMMLKGGARGR